MKTEIKSNIQLTIIKCTTYLCCISDFLTIWQAFASFYNIRVVHDGIKLFKFVGFILPSEANVDFAKILGNWIVPRNAVGLLVCIPQPAFKQTALCPVCLEHAVCILTQEIWGEIYFHFISFQTEKWE